MKKSLYILSLLFWVFISGCGHLNSDFKQMSAKEIEKSKIEPSPNIILITINSLRADHVGAYGYSRNTTPNLDRFAEENTLFTSAFATSSWQMPTHGSILTSLYPSEHKGTHINNKLSETCKTLPEILSSHGYYTVGFCCNPRLGSDMGFSRGFDLYDDFSVGMFLSNISMDATDNVNINRQRTNDLINQSAMRWLENNKAEPFFLYLHYYDNHWDYLPPEPYYSMFDPDYEGKLDGSLISKEPLYSNPPSEEDIDHIIALYDGEIRQTDEDLGTFLDCLADMDLFENSIIVILGEHGEQFYEHGNTSHHGLYEEMIRIPMAIHFPGRELAKYNNLASQVDLLPTLLDSVGLKEHLPSDSKGVSLIGAAANEKQRDWIYVEYTGGAIPNCSALRSGRYKIIRSEEGIEVYDLENDERELRPLKVSQYNSDINNLIRVLDGIENNSSSEVVVLED